MNRFLESCSSIFSCRQGTGVAEFLDGLGKDFDSGQTSIYNCFDDEILDRVFFVGHHAAIEEGFVDADICTHLSFRDSAPMTVLEAQAAGKPVIVNTAGGMRNLLSPSFANHPMVVSEIEEFENSLSELVESSEKRRRIGALNKAYIQSEYSPEKLGKDFKKAIKQFSS